MDDHKIMVRKRKISSGQRNAVGSTQTGEEK